MKLHLPSMRAAFVLIVNGLAHAAEGAFCRLDARICRASNDLSGEDS